MISAILGVLVGLAIREWLIVPRYQYHEPRAMKLPAPPREAPQPTFHEQITEGRATFRGKCAWCRGPWKACASGCVTRSAQARPWCDYCGGPCHCGSPVRMPVPGPGRSIRK